MHSVKGSKTLQAFLERSEALQESINDDIVDMIEEENSLVSDKVSQSKFAYLVIKHRYYDKLNEDFFRLNKETKLEITNIRQMESKIIKILSERDRNETVERFLHQMVENIIKIDQKKPELKKPSNLNFAEEYKEGLVTAESKLGFVLKQNKVFSVDYLTQKEVEIEELKKSYYAKLMPISNKSLLVVGG